MSEFIENNDNRHTCRPIGKVYIGIIGIPLIFDLICPPARRDRYAPNVLPLLKNPIDTIEGENKEKRHKGIPLSYATSAVTSTRAISIDEKTVRRVAV